jgi:hypothetical protein
MCDSGKCDLSLTHGTYRHSIHRLGYSARMMRPSTSGSCHPVLPEGAVVLPGDTYVLPEGVVDVLPLSGVPSVSRGTITVSRHLIGQEPDSR